MPMIELQKFLVGGRGDGAARRRCPRGAAPRGIEVDVDGDGAVSQERIWAEPWSNVPRNQILNPFGESLTSIRQDPRTKDL